MSCRRPLSRIENASRVRSGTSRVSAPMTVAYTATVRTLPRNVDSCPSRGTAAASMRQAIMTRMALIDEGKKAPAFTLTDQDGNTHRLSDYAGRPVILYFYPKDDTPGCTKESCDFRDNLVRFNASRAAVFGISILDEASKAKFA